MSPITPRNILRHELIGLKTFVASSSDKRLRGKRGMIVDETKNTITVSDGARTVKVPKSTATFHFYLPSGVTVEVVGRRLVGRPEDRLKTRFRRW